MGTASLTLLLSNRTRSTYPYHSIPPKYQNSLSINVQIDGISTANDLPRIAPLVRHHLAHLEVGIVSEYRGPVSMCRQRLSQPAPRRCAVTPRNRHNVRRRIGRLEERRQLADVHPGIPNSRGDFLRQAHARRQRRSPSPKPEHGQSIPDCVPNTPAAPLTLTTRRLLFNVSQRPANRPRPSFQPLTL